MPPTLRAGRVMPGVHFGSNENIDQRSDSDPQIRVGQACDGRIECGESDESGIAGAEERERQEVDQSIQDLFKGVKAYTRKPVEFSRAVMCFVKSPPPLESMLRAVSPIKDKIEDDDNDHKLNPNGLI